MNTQVSSPLPLLRRSLLAGGALVAGIALGAGGLAVAAGGVPAGMPAPWRHGPHLEHIQQAVARALDGVGATTAQEGKIHDIIAATVTGLETDAGGREALREQAIALLKAPTIDRAAVEALRAQQVAKFDAMSKTVVQAALDAADQLTPPQRAQLADRAEALMQRPGMDGPWGRPHGPRGPWMDGHDPMHGGGPDDEGPGHEPGPMPDKG